MNAALLQEGTSSPPEEEVVVQKTWSDQAARTYLPKKCIECIVQSSFSLEVFIVIGSCNSLTSLYSSAWHIVRNLSHTQIVLTEFYSSALSIGRYIHTHPPTKSCKAEKVWLVLQTALVDFITLLNRGLSKYWVWPQIWKTQIRPTKLQNIETITVFIFSFFHFHI